MSEATAGLLTNLIIAIVVIILFAGEAILDGIKGIVIAWRMKPAEKKESQDADSV